MNKKQEKKELLIASLMDVRRRVIDLAETCPSDRRSEVFLGTWSLWEILAHLSGWDVVNIAAGNEIQAGKLPIFYQYVDRGWKSYNAVLVEQYRKPQFEDQLALAQSTHDQLIQYLKELPADELWQDHGIRYKGWIVTLGKLLKVLAKDEDIHYQQIKNFLESKHA